MNYKLLPLFAVLVSLTIAETTSPRSAASEPGAGVTSAPAKTPDAAVTADTDLKSILASIDKSMFPVTALAAMRMVDYKQNRQTGESVKNKTLEMELRTHEDNALIEMKAPAVDRGKFILKNNQGLWLFHSKIKRSIRISARDDFNGTSASNYDILEMKIIRDYEVGAHTRETVEGRELLKVQLSARPGTQGYEKIVSWIDPKEGIIVRNECYAISGMLIKTISYQDYRVVDHYRVPMAIRIDSAIRKGSYSTVEFTRIEATSAVQEHIFSLGYLESLN